MGLTVGEVVDTATGSEISREELIDKLSEASVVYLGETHTSSQDHALQLEILRGLQARGRCVILGMEMFPRSAQPALDRYIQGASTEEEFLREVQWEKVWGFPYQLYRGLIDFAREKHLRVVGLNAPGKVVSEIAHNGLASLSPEDRARLARDFHLDDPKNRARILKEYQAHGKTGIKDFDSFFQAQLAWEETMAETLADQLRMSGDKCRIVVIVGKGHISGGLGIPYLANLRVPHEYATVAPVAIDYPGSSRDPNLARYVAITDSSEPTRRPRLGVMIQTAASGRGVEILDVLPDSAAAKADIRKGDLVTMVNGSPVKAAEELQQAIADGGPEYSIVIERAKKQLTLNVSLKP